MPTNSWTIGTMYYGGKLNGQPFWTQPGGPGTAVLPATRSGVPWTDYPTPGQVISEFSPWVNPGCLHAVKWFSIIHEYDYTTNQSVALLVCPQCSYVQRAVSPYEEILNPIQYAVIVG